MAGRHAHSTPPARLSAPFASAVLDIEALRDRAGYDEPFVVELLEDFLVRGVSMNEVCAAAEAQEFADLATVAHRLKGALAALGAMPAASAAGEVELRAATLAIAPTLPEARSLAALAAAVVELDARFTAASDAMREVIDAATSMAPPTSLR